MPSPSYTTHTLGEIGHAHSAPSLFCLKPENNWYPDMEDLRNHVRYNPNICAIMLINPDNPTGMVYTRELLQEIVAVARENDLFIIADEVYINIVYNGESTVPISDVIGDVPAISLKGISKEFPWPGSRCGWIEVYNGQKDERFQKYINLILTGKMNEVCSTTLPQMVIPEIVTHPEYSAYLAQRIDSYERMSNITYDCLSRVPAPGSCSSGESHQRCFLYGCGIQGWLAEQPAVDSDSKPGGQESGGGADQPAGSFP